MYLSLWLDQIQEPRNKEIPLANTIIVFKKKYIHFYFSKPKPYVWFIMVRDIIQEKRK